MNNSLTDRQIAFILFGIIVGYGIMPMAKNVAENGGTGGWFALLIATLITAIFTYIITYLGYVHKNKTIYEYSQLLLGKFFTNIFMIIYIIYFFMFFTMIIRMASEVIRLTILLKTPVCAMCLLFLVAVYYAVSKGIRVIARICEIYGLIIIIFLLTIQLAIFTQGDIINLKPFFVLEDIKSYIKATSTIIFPFIGIEILAVIPLDKKENSKKIFGYNILMVVFIGILYILVAESCISVMGVDGIIYYKDSLLATIRRIEIPHLQFLRRLDGIFLPIWIMTLFCTFILSAYGSVFLTSKLFKNTSHKKITFVVVITSFIIAQIPNTINQIEKLMDYISYLGIIVSGIIPVILFVATKVKRYDTKNK
ncbi:GerAB/ArcD/ProY family transporter [Paramaledivibacter caminithermalis]|jgi:spore germination protein|uniref:Spore germination protein n=1 Tax=Paramaledivibacter caminithermalis (strain DSM 15212 / CIP 107654 / DViRD3) TaxID=1121301 RepID=A0A1M6LRI3_PARC5|nr:endospore germination permease [Paramaledivibacter caminithermalis]SHJ73834.1 spore germination protein [Paramaledivibacter caminithermalis DSM 15212]